MRHRGIYPPDWPEIAIRIKAAAGWKCERCRRRHNPAKGYTLTVHHLDLDKSNCADWNLAALCQRCHLIVQARLVLGQLYFWAAPKWLRVHLEGYFGSLRG